MAIGKSLRFEIFARDGFVCQYCGKRPPDTVLEVDHIHPVSKGGDDDPINLITSCFDCNRGKRAKVISEIAPRPDANLALLRVQQEIAEVQQYLKAKKKRDCHFAKVCDALRETWSQFLTTETVPHDRALVTWLKIYGPEEIECAIKIAAPFYMSNKYWSEDKMFKALLPYIGAVLRNRRNDGVPNGDN
jgi:hypothetical protein